ncbi:MAG: hypothetical protein ACTSW1_01165 [Candidatus Hodarchaeales archaeon]
MGRKSKKGTIEHFGVLIIAQDKWREEDEKNIRRAIQEYRVKLSEEIGSDYHLFDKLIYIKKDEFIGYDYGICNNLTALFKELKGKTDNILYLGHHYLVLPEDLNEIATLTRMILENPKVKKFYVLYFDSLSEFKTNELKKMDFGAVKRLISIKKCFKEEFLAVLKANKFKARTLYEVNKVWFGLFYLLLSLFIL